jgi:phytanoyl-CoA dioxygenase PhyH
MNHVRSRPQRGAPTRQAAQPTYEVARGAIDQELIDDALRLLHLDLLARGASADEIGGWLWGAHWFPHLIRDPAILALERALAPGWRTGELCDPQILLQFPHAGPEPEITFHLDQEPEWAAGRAYRRVVGIPLSRWCADNGGLLVRIGDSTVPVELDPGDAVMMAPDLWHSGGINRTGAIRYGIYFRWLEPGSPGMPPTAAESSASRVRASSDPSSKGSQT